MEISEPTGLPPQLSKEQMETVGRFASLFQGRTDFLGAEEGGCIRLYHDSTREPQMVWIIQGHLAGSRPPIGIYPVVKKTWKPSDGIATYGFAVKFGAVDIDVQDFGLATNLWKALSALDIVSWVEKSRSKGYHVWVFSSEWVPAVLMRSVLQVACDVVGYNPKEIYPKQTELADGSPGNYIRLPYPGSLLASPGGATGRYMLDMEDRDRGVLRLDEFVNRAYANRVSRSVLEEAASLAKKAKPKNRQVVRDLPVQVHVDRLTKRLSGKAFVIFRDGPLEGSDRSSTLFKLVALMRQEGFAPDEAFVVLQEADARWGKFWDRADGEDRLWEMVERIYDEEVG